MEERSQAIEKLKTRWQVNTKLLAFKFHFFFMLGGFAAIMPYMTLIAKQLGIHAAAVGIAYSMIPFFIFLSSPIFGLLVDYFQNIKIFIVILIVISSTAYSSVLSLPPVKDFHEDSISVRVSYPNDSEILMNISQTFEKSCINAILDSYVECKLGFKHETETRYNKSESIEFLTYLNITHSPVKAEKNEEVAKNTSWIDFYTEDTILADVKDKTSSLVVFQCSPDIHHCTITPNFNAIFYTFQFWTFFILVVIGTITSQAVMTLSSAACYELLDGEIDYYGRQRLFGTISWGIICPLSGLLNDLQTENNFLSSVYLLVPFILTDIILICFTNIPRAHISISMRKDLLKIFSTKTILIFCFGVTIVGILNAIIALFEFWFLEDLGASRTLLGLSVLMQCLVGEVPFLFFAGWFVKKFGHYLCFAWVFGGFLLRLVLYSLLRNPWMALPIDILHGVTFGLYHGVMTSFAKVKAPEGMEATLLGIFSGLYDGLGYGIGSIFGGFGLERLGPKQTFLSASMLSLCGFLSFLVASYTFKVPPKRNASQVTPVELEEIARTP